MAQTLTTSCNQGVIIQRSRGNNHGGIHRISPTVTTNSFQHNNLLYDRFVVRRLTPRECWRLQGFPDWAFEKAKETGMSDSQLYKQAGNSVTVNVVYEIGRLL
ncbi:DNA cytosine methyltransferase [Peptostreptococcus canis]|uniref:DNA cytosine methyltransferase n=1 Tax=Peptostreptococcus canis TaxID=1159213 RepID=UPI002FE6DCDE